MKPDADANPTPHSQRRDWAQRVGGLSGLPALVRMLGVDADAVLGGAGLPAAALDSPDNRIGYDAFGRLLEHAARLADCSHVGLLAGRMCHIDNLDAVGRIVRHSTSVGESLQALIAYQHLNSEGGVFYSTRYGTTVEVGYGIYYPNIVGADQIHDWALAFTFNVLQELCGSRWLPSEALLPHSRRSDTVHYRNLFKVQPQFDAEVCALRFPAFWLDHGVEAADPVKRREAVKAVYAGREPDLLQQVYRALRKLLMAGSSSGDDTADALSMHRRTLNRRLQQHGTTFQEVLDKVRCEVARQLLCYSAVPLDDIAASLGYAGVSPFMRSFRRWTGETPGRLRQSATRTDERAAMPTAGPRGQAEARAVGSPLRGKRTLAAPARFPGNNAARHYATTDFDDVIGLDSPLRISLAAEARPTRSLAWHPPLAHNPPATAVSADSRRRAPSAVRHD